MDVQHPVKAAYGFVDKFVAVSRFEGLRKYAFSLIISYCCPVCGSRGEKTVSVDFSFLECEVCGHTEFFSLTRKKEVFNKNGKTNY